jgi:dienelactone hydrolase
MDRREFLQSATAVAAAGAAVTTIAAAAAPPAAAQAAKSASFTPSMERKPKGEPVVKRFDEQRWLLDNIIQANSIDWDQSHTGVLLRSCGLDVQSEMTGLRQRVKRYVDIAPAFEALARRRETMAKDAEQSGEKMVARDNYYISAVYWATAMWPIDELNDKIKMYNDKKRELYGKYMALADHHIEWVEIPYRGKSLPAIFHLPPGYQTGSKVPVIVSVPGMDGFKERSVALSNDAWMQRGVAVLAMEGPGYWESPVRGLFVDVPGWVETGKTIADWLAARPEIDVGKIGMTGSSFGSFFSAIMMAADARFKACAVTGTCYEPGGTTIFDHASPTFKKRFMFMSGITDEAEFEQFRKTIDWKGYAEKVKGAYLVLCGEYDQLCPLEATEDFVKSLGGPKQLVVYEGGDHSIGSTTASANGPEPRRLQAEWIMARLNDKPLRSEQWFVQSNGKVDKKSIA